jgi:hypothetical protein
MLKRVALLGAIAALTIGNPARAAAQAWDGAGYGYDGAGYDGGRWGGGGCCVTVTVRVAIRPRPWCCHPVPPRPVVCCRPYVPPRPVLCCNNYPYYGRPLYYYGDRFAAYGYNPYAGYNDTSYYGE